MAPLYLKLSESHDWPVDAPLLAKMEKSNAEAIKKVDEKIADAKENQGETEVRDAILEKALYYAKIANKVCFGFSIIIVLFKTARAHTSTLRADSFVRIVQSTARIPPLL